MSDSSTFSVGPSLLPSFCPREFSQYSSNELDELSVEQTYHRAIAHKLKIYESAPRTSVRCYMATSLLLSDT